MMDSMNYRMHNPSAEVSVDESISQAFVSKPRTPEQVERFRVMASMSSEAQQIDAILEAHILKQNEVKQAVR